MRRIEQHTIRDFLREFQTGEERGFDHYFHTYYKGLCFFADLYMRDRPSAEDIVSQVFLRLWQHRQKIKSEDHLRNWLYRSVHHACIDQFKKNKTREKRLQVLEDGAEKEEPDYSQQMIRAETIRQLRQAIDLLPGQCKKIFYKLYIEGKTVKETAQEMQLAISTIDNQKARGIKLLRQRLTHLPLIGWLLIIPGL